MDREFWLERWEQNQIGFHQEQCNAHLQQFWDQVGAAPGSTVFVPLSGKSLDMVWLRGRGHPVLGIELSRLAVEAFFEENGLEPEVHQDGEFEVWRADGVTLLCGDFFNLRPEQLAEVGAVYDRASLIALPPELRSRYAEHMSTLLPAGVPFLLITMEYPQAQMSGPPFSVSEQEVNRLYGSFRIDKLLEQDILSENPRFAERGLEAMSEKVYLIRRE